MDKPCFRIQREPEAGLIRIRLSGFWDQATVTEFETSLRQVLRSHTTDRLVLIDARKHDVQSREVMDRFKQVTAQVRRPGTRVAVLVGSALGKMQAQRIDPQASHRVFTSESESLAWLLADGG